MASDEKVCAGSCNGRRACAFPNATKTCGGTFCNSAADRGRAACDGAGHCSLGVESCQAFACPAGEGTCKTQCTTEADCAKGHYCDSTGTCRPRLGDAAVCSAVPQCQSGFCVTNVCCNDSCSRLGGSCTSPGKVGQCTCAACASGGACTLWYRDADGDGYGDEKGTLVNGNALAGCVTGAAPAAGFVKNTTDCDDTPAGRDVHPGQTRYFTSPVNGSFDFDCSGTITKETRESIGGACGFCGSGPRLSCDHSKTCNGTTAISAHECGFSKCTTGLCCTGSSVSAFRASAACGAPGNLFTCGGCVGKIGAPSSTTSSRVQGCH